MKSQFHNLVVFLIGVSFYTHANASDSLKTDKPVFQYKNGLGVVAPDSLFSINFRFRVQTRAAYTSNSTEDLSASQIEARVRRLRLRFEGFILNPKLNYYIQLSVSRGDMDWEVRDNALNNSSPNIVRDAVITYKANKKLNLLFGQTKLPGNRQRVVSSGEQQFAERSIVNATFNIDRDFGLQARYFDHFGNFHYALKGAITSGEGRNSNASNGGLAYTSRLELLPLGKFTNKGDDFEGDLEREKTPKISLAATYHYNDQAVRTAGTLGKDLYNTRNLGSFMADVLFKYRGFCLYSEYITRETPNPVTTSAALTRHVYVGNGFLTQISYCFPNKFEIAGRYARINPTKSIQSLDLQKEETGFGVSKYLNNHRVKVQANVFYLRDENLSKPVSTTNERWSAIFQIELGI